jgi:hypothetical protein
VAGRRSDGGSHNSLNQLTPYSTFYGQNQMSLDISGAMLGMSYRDGP